MTDLARYTRQGLHWLRQDAKLISWTEHTLVASDFFPQHCVTSQRKTAITHHLVDTKNEEWFSPLWFMLLFL
jgi:hypothetical protein